MELPMLRSCTAGASKATRGLPSTRTSGWGRLGAAIILWDPDSTSPEAPGMALLADILGVQIRSIKWGREACGDQRRNVASNI